MLQQTDDRYSNPRTTRRNCVLLAAIFAVVYGALLSTQWLAGTPDSEYYLAIARNLAAGMGFVWNGQPVLMVPPAWPILLAGAMKISTSMLFLNLIPYTLSLMGIVLWYCVLEKLTTPRRAFWVMVIFGILFNYHRFAQHFYSEALFVPLLAATLLLALRIRHGPIHPWHVAMMLVLCCSLVLIRWAGIFVTPLIVAACYAHRPWKEQKGARIAAGVAILAMVGTFLIARSCMDSYAASWHTRMQASITRATPSAEPDAFVGAKSAEEVPDLQWHSKRTSTAVARARNWNKRIAEGGHWLAGLYWPPAQAAQSLRGPGLVVNIIGWLMWIPLVVGAVAALRKGTWIWLGVFLLCGTTMMLAGVRGRYLVPVAPLLLLATFNGIDILTDTHRCRAWRHVGQAIRFAGVGSIVLCNILIWAGSVWALHTSRFREVWCGGDYAAIVDIADYLARQDAHDGEIAVSRCMANFGRSSQSEATGRLLHLLTARTLEYSPQPLSQQPPNEQLARWADKHGIRYYVYRPPMSPWRISHFRLPWLQEKMTGQPVTIANPSFVLYQRVDDGLQEVHVPRTNTCMTVVPGWPLSQPTPPVAGGAGHASPL